MDHVVKLVLFGDVVRLQSFSKAAQKWSLTHSTVSKHIKALEGHLGAQLLHRTSRTMSLTQAGEIAFEYSARVATNLDELSHRLDSLLGEVTGELVVSSLIHLADGLVYPAIASFLEAHPKASVRLELTDQPLRFYEQGLDLALRVGLPSEESLTAFKVAENDVVFAASPALMERQVPVTHPSQLSEFPTIGYASGGTRITTWRYVELGEIKTVDVSPRCLVSDGSALRAAALEGIGVGYFSAFSIAKDLRDGSLQRLLPEFELPAYAPVYALYQQTSFGSPKLESFKTYLRRAASELSDL